MSKYIKKLSKAFTINLKQKTLKSPWPFDTTFQETQRHILEWGFFIRNFSMDWKLVRAAQSPASPRPTESESAFFTRFPGESMHLKVWEILNERNNNDNKI